MIIIAVFGGLGNQMFQYANGISTARATQQDLAIDSSLIGTYASRHNGFELQKIFNITTKECSRRDLARLTGIAAYSKHLRKLFTQPYLAPIRNHTFICEGQTEIQQSSTTSQKNGAYLYGYWQSEKHFSDHSTAIRKLFKFPALKTKKDKALENQIITNNSISIHVRRGDYITNPQAATTHGSCSIQYYQNAIQHITKRIRTPHFFIFSDDTEWARSEIAPMTNQSTVVDGHSGNESFRDMQLMSRCKHHIIANSSFSWWGAWLNPCSEKIIVSPSAWFADGSTPSNLIPEKWIRI